VQSADPVIRVSGFSGWPEGANLERNSGTNEWGDWTDAHIPFDGHEFALPTLEAGWYAIGVWPGYPNDGARWFPQATPSLHFKGGEYAIEFLPVPAGTLRGRVVGDTSAEFVAVSLVGVSGTSPTTTLSGSTGATPIVDVPADGNFVLYGAPTGRYRLRAGSREELARGEYRREIEVEIQPGENPPVEIRL
jgi:hypothetical protein